MTGARTTERAGPGARGARRPRRRARAVPATCAYGARRVCAGLSSIRAPGPAAAAGALALLLIAAAGLPAHAGQVRIDVGAPPNQFTPRAANLNLGDHAVWVWTAGTHTVSSGDSSLVLPDRIFDSTNGSDFATSNTRYSWKSDRTGTLLYFCIPHAPQMSGRLILTDPGVSPEVPVSDFRITEVQFNVPGGQDLIEITNYGLAAGNLGRYRLAIAGTGFGVEIPLNEFPVPSGGRVVIHANASGTNDATNIYLPGLANLPEAGSLALYVPSNLAFQGLVGNGSLMLDFVQWGAGGQANEATAVTAGFWGSGTSINGVGAGHSIEYCADADLNHGVSRWAEINPPNFGANGDCLTPTVDTSWGRLKSLYRK